MIVITIYADILFLVNFSMDILALYLTGRFLGKKIKTARLCIAATLGGLTATATAVLPAGVTIVENLICVVSGLLVSVAMARICFGKYDTAIGLIGDSVVLWGTGALLGGIMTSILSLGAPVFVGTGNTSEFPAAFTLCFLISYLAVRFISASGRKERTTVVLDGGGCRAKFSALCDSGNLATEPLSGLPVVIVSYTVCGELARMVREGDVRLKIRAVPIKTVGGERLLMGFIPDCIVIDGEAAAAAVAIDTENRSFGGCGAIVPSALCRRHIIKRRAKNGEKTADSVHR